MKTRVNSLIAYVTLFSSSSTLICCALPSLFVLLGAGAVFASLLEVFPFLITLSEHKLAIFIFAFIMLAASGLLQWYVRQESCPIDVKQAEACGKTRVWSKYIYIFSCLCFAIGFSITYIVPIFL